MARSGKESTVLAGRFCNNSFFHCMREENQSQPDDSQFLIMKLFFFQSSYSFKQKLIDIMLPKGQENSLGSRRDDLRIECCRNENVLTEKK